MTQGHLTTCFYHLFLTNWMVPLLMLSASCYSDAGTIGIMWLKKVTVHLVSIVFAKQTIDPLSMPSASHDASYDDISWAKIYITPCFDHLNLSDKWCHWWYIKIMGHWCQCQQNPLIESQVALNFDCPGLTNVIGQLIIPSTSFDDDAKSITWPKKSWCTLSWSSLPNKYSKPIYNVISLCHADNGTNGVTLPKDQIAPYFDCFDVMNAMMLLMMLSASYGQKNQVVLHFICLDLQMQWCHCQFH